MLARSRESRKNVRRWMRREAKIILEPHKLPIRCVVHDLSDGGARLSFIAPLPHLPRSITLVLFKNSVQRDCELVWTDGHFVGVKFVSEWFGTKSAEQGSASKKSRQEPRGPQSNA
jgi:hypothetical protein